MQLKSFDWRGAHESEYAAFNSFRNKLRKGWLPDDPPIPLAEDISGCRNRPASDVIEAWNIWNADHSAIIAAGNVVFRHSAENQHLVEFTIEVLPAFRRQGLARKLLAKVVELPMREKRRLMLCWTTDLMPEGEVFLQRLGAARGLVERVSQLKLNEVNRNLIDAWIARAPVRADGFELGFWDGALPEADIANIAELHKVMNDAPRGTLDIEDEQFTPGLLREWEQSWFARGVQPWWCYTREKSSGKLAGFSTTFWNPTRAHLVYQGGTGVWPQYRNNGLGRWMKAVMLERILRERPQAQVIRTDNAETNAPMLKINYELGFKHYCANAAWQIETEKVVSYLSNSKDG